MSLVTQHQVCAVSYFDSFSPNTTQFIKILGFLHQSQFLAHSDSHQKKFAKLKGRSQFGSTLLVAQSESCVFIFAHDGPGRTSLGSPSTVMLFSCCPARNDPAKRLRDSNLKQNHFLRGRWLDVTLQC